MSWNEYCHYDCPNQTKIHSLKNSKILLERTIWAFFHQPLDLEWLPQTNSTTLAGGGWTTCNKVFLDSLATEQQKTSKDMGLIVRECRGKHWRKPSTDALAKQLLKQDLSNSPVLKSSNFPQKYIYIYIYFLFFGSSFVVMAILRCHVIKQPLHVKRKGETVEI